MARGHHLPHSGLRGRVAQHYLWQGCVPLHRSHGNSVACRENHHKSTDLIFPPPCWFLTKPRPKRNIPLLFFFFAVFCCLPTHLHVDSIYLFYFIAQGSAVSGTVPYHLFSLIRSVSVPLEQLFPTFFLLPYFARVHFSSPGFALYLSSNWEARCKSLFCDAERPRGADEAPP